MSFGFGLGPRTWATHQLHKGDLTALAAIVHGGKPDDERAKRLARRGFIAVKPSGRCLITPRGRMALIVRRFLPH